MRSGAIGPIPVPFRAIRKEDVAALLLIAGFAFMIWLDVLNTRVAGTYPAGDVAVYSSYAAGWLWPEAFSDDPFLADRWTTMHYLAVLQLPPAILAYLFLGNFAAAFSVMVFPLTLAQGLGFYVLGRQVFGGRLRSLILVAATYLPILGTSWYISNYAMGRLWYMALFPFLVFAFLRFAPAPRTWPWLMAAAGLTMHVHPVSAPVVGFALLCGLVAHAPAAWTARRLLIRLFLSGLAFIAGALPFIAINFLMTSTGPIADYGDFLMIRGFYSNAFAGAGAFAGWFFARTNVVLLLSAGLLGAVAGWRLGGRDRVAVRFLLLHCGGLVLASVVFPWAEHLFATANEVRPNLTEAVRGLRYLLPVAWVCLLIGVFAVLDRLRPTLRPGTALAILLVCLYGASTKLSKTPPYVFAWYQFVPSLTGLIHELDAQVIVTDVRLTDWQRRRLGRVTYRNDGLTVIDTRRR